MTESPPDGTQADELNATIDDIELGFGVLSLSKAVHRIDSWQRTLAASDRADLNEIADGLGELKSRLLGPNLDGASIGAALAQLGEQTVAASKEAEREATSKAVERLGNLLLHAGHALRGPRADGS